MSIAHARRGKGRNMRSGDYTPITKIDPAPRKGLPGNARRLRHRQPCIDCGVQMAKGTVVFWVEQHRGWRHPKCLRPLQPDFVPAARS